MSAISTQVQKDIATKAVFPILGAISFCHLLNDMVQSLITAADNRFPAVAKANPQFRGKNALLLQGTIFQDQVRATLPGWRTDFLTQMGFRIPDSINAFTIDEHRFIPRDQIVSVLNTADVLIWTTQSAADV